MNQSDLRVRACALHLFLLVSLAGCYSHPPDHDATAADGLRTDYVPGRVYRLVKPTLLVSLKDESHSYPQFSLRPYRYGPIDMGGYALVAVLPSGTRVRFDAIHLHYGFEIGEDADAEGTLLSSDWQAKGRISLRELSGGIGSLTPTVRPDLLTPED